MSAEEEEEEDYMSDAFLAKCSDTRPGLVSKTAARQHHVERKAKEADAKSKTKTKKVLETESRDEGLGTALKQDNKGFALLAKMGYKPGMALGRDGSGRTEPVPIQLKACRTGLGMVADRKRKQEEVAAMRAQLQSKRQKMMQTLQSEYQHQHRSRQRQKEAERDLGKSQRACYQLDQIQDWVEPTEDYFWPAQIMQEIAEKQAKEQGIREAGHTEDEESEPTAEGETAGGGTAGIVGQEEAGHTPHKQEKEDEASMDSLTTEDKLEILTAYLRSTYLYCIWCGTQYEEEEDLKTNCPGDTAADHDE